MPYVQLEGIYQKYTQHNGYPVYKHEQRNYHFEYMNSNEENLMAFSVSNASTSRRSYMGLRAAMTNGFKSTNWVYRIADTIHPLQRFIAKWEYYDWQSKTHISIPRGAVSFTCVPAGVYRCSSQRVYFNTTFTSSQNGEVLHNHLTDYFEELTGGYNDYKNCRKQYRHSRNSDWILYYESPYWKVKSSRSSTHSPFLRAKDSSFRPEYITTPWQHLDGSWKSFTNPVGIRCRGYMQHHGNGTAKSCTDSNPCLNGGMCVNSKLTNETICRCDESLTGLRCEKRAKRCSKYLHEPKSVQNVIVYGLESSNFATVFCKENYKPRYYLSQCITDGYTSSWSHRRMCYFAHSKVLHRDRRETVLFDDPAAKGLLVVILVIILKVAVTVFNAVIAYRKRKNVLRIISIHAFIFYIFWWIFFLSCTIGQCQNHNTPLADLLILSYVMMPVCYMVMIFESGRSAERQYLSSFLTDVSVIEFVEKLKRTDPQRMMTVQCYHWVTTSSSSTQSSSREKVTTYTETQVFPIGSTQDISDPGELCIDLLHVTRLKLTPDIQCGDESTTLKFTEMRHMMIENNKYRDNCIDFNYSDVIPGFKERVCVYSDATYLQWWMTSRVYWISSLCGLTWAYRIIFNNQTRKCECTIKKLIYYIPNYDNGMATASYLQGTNNAPFCVGLQNIDTIQGSPASQAQQSNTFTSQVSPLYGTNNAAFCVSLQNINTAQYSSASLAQQSNTIRNQVLIPMITNQVVIPTMPQEMPIEQPPAYDEAVQSSTRVRSEEMEQQTSSMAKHIDI